jgi:hypothetical protein
MEYFLFIHNYLVLLNFLFCEAVEADDANE